jgi:class 3 adenylate cyclase/tetratricopeptide (TPR) repeat protein
VNANDPTPSTTAATLAPYLPRLVIDWLRETPEARSRAVDGTGVFADISGFTNLTEKLSRRGRVGAEEMGDTLNLIFGALLEPAYDLGAGLIKWGGDAVLLLFQGEDHAIRAAQAGAAMQRVMARIGRVKTGSGEVRLRMSIGMHSGALDFLLVGERFRELIVTGPGASAIARMETAAEAGEVVLSPSTAAAVADAGGSIGEAKGPGFLLVRPPTDQPDVDLVARTPTGLDLSTALPRPLVEHVLAGDVAYEHRSIAVAFLEFSGVDEMRARSGLETVADAVGAVVDACQRAAEENDVTFLSSDIYPDGGKVILVAGAPRNTGDDAARVLNAARQVLDQSFALSVRAGVNIGRVFAGDYGPAYRRVYSVTGDCVNLAARLMAKAGPGELVASEAALGTSRTRFETVALEPFAVKGKSGLIEASLVGAPDAAWVPQTGNVLPLVGRAEELALLVDRWESARAGAGRQVEIVGEPGVGKSRLLRELVDVSAVRPLWLDGNMYATRTPFEPFHRLFEQRVGIDRSMPDAADRLRDLVAGLDPALLAWLPLIGIVADIPIPETDEVRALDDAARKERLEAATSAVLGALLRDPTLMVFNDVDFMDEASTDLLDRLAADGVDRPWLLVVTRRPTAEWRPRPGPHVTTLQLAALGPEAADELLATALVDAVLPAHRMAELVERSGGNPLFLTELAAGLGRGVDADAVPDTVEGLIGARIDRMPPPARALLRTAAVLGVRVDRALLAEVVARTDRGPDLSLLDSLADLLEPVGDTLCFAHNLIRETAYAGLPFRQRRGLHSVAADILVGFGTAASQPALLSLHCYNAGRYEEALEYSTQAAKLARAQYAPTEAADNYRRAIGAGRRLPAVQRDTHRLGELWLTVGWVYHDLGDLDAMALAGREARRLARGDAVEEARAAEMVAVHRRMTGDYPGSLRWLSAGVRSLTDLDTPDAHALRASLLERYARSRLSQGRLREAVAWADRAIEAARAGGDERGAASAIETRSVAASNAGSVVDLDEVAATIAIWERDDDLRRAARTHNVVGVLALNQNEWTRALRHYRASTEIYERINRPTDVALQMTNMAEILIFQGRLDDAENALSAALRLLRAAPDTTEHAFAVGQQGRVAMARGDNAAALELYGEARRVQEEIGDLYEVVILDAFIAETYQLAGDGEEALDRLADLRVRNRSVGATLDYMARVEGRALVLVGREDEGLAVLRAALDASRAGAALYDEWRLLVALVELGAAGAEDRDALASLRPVLRDRLGLTEELVRDSLALLG